MSTDNGNSNTGKDRVELIQKGTQDTGMRTFMWPDQIRNVGTIPKVILSYRLVQFEIYL